MAGTTRRSWIVAVVLALLARVAAAEPSAEQRIRILEEQLRRTQQQVQELKAMMEQQKAIGQATQKQVNDASEQAKAAVDTSKKTAAVELPDWMKRTTVFGDVRFRHEGFYHQPHVAGADVTARNRERIRARLGVRVVFSDELSATIRGATGRVTDPISTNEDLGGDFTRKNFNLDWGFLTFTPGKSFGIRPGLVSVNAGKFPNPIFRVGEMVFDEDISAEGLSETFQLLEKPVGLLDQVKVHALQWTFSEIANKCRLRLQLAGGDGARQDAQTQKVGGHDGKG